MTIARLEKKANFYKSKVEKYEDIRKYDRGWFTLKKLRSYKKLRLQAKDLLAYLTRKSA
tara:strand:+ start:2857 stop:3033 length:177 start_codon:yes stop_codon:yes gene_type:complete